MAAHTPGPWHVDGSSVTGADGHRVADVRDSVYAKGVTRDRDANARLIAEAPAMLDVLRAFVDTLGPDDHVGCVGTLGCSFNDARAILARIDGAA
jgi:hypothetical protein